MNTSLEKSTPFLELDYYVEPDPEARAQFLLEEVHKHIEETRLRSRFIANLHAMKHLWQQRNATDDRT